MGLLSIQVHRESRVETGSGRRVYPHFVKVISRKTGIALPKVEAGFKFIVVVGVEVARNWRIP